MTRATIEGRRGKNRTFYANESEVFDGAAFIYFGKMVFFFYTTISGDKKMIKKFKSKWPTRPERN